MLCSYQNSERCTPKKVRESTSTKKVSARSMINERRDEGQMSVRKG